jgi:uncharacterized protein (DUF111 family)
MRTILEVQRLIQDRSEEHFRNAREDCMSKAARPGIRVLDRIRLMLKRRAERIRPRATRVDLGGTVEVGRLAARTEGSESLDL